MSLSLILVAQIFGGLILLGFLLHIVNNKIPMDKNIKRIFNAAVLAGVSYYLLHVGKEFGIKYMDVDELLKAGKKLF